MSNRNPPSGPRISWQDPVANAAALPLVGNTSGDARVALNTSVVWVWNGTAWTTGAAAEDHKVAVTAADAVPSFLANKISTDQPTVIVLSVQNPGANEQLQIHLNAGALYPVPDNVFSIDDDVDPTKFLNVELSGQATGTTQTIVTTATISRPFRLPDISGTAVVMQDVSGQVFIGLGVTGTLHGSNNGVQYSSTVANRGAYRGNQYGNNTGIPGMTAFKSRGTTIGALAPVLPGDVIGRFTSIGVASDGASIPLAGYWSFNVPAGFVPAGQAWTPTEFELELTPLAGPANGHRISFKVSSEGETQTLSGVRAGGPNTTPATISTASALIRSGNGNPNGSIIGSVGDVWLELNGTPGGILWTKETGTATNTGWVSVVSSSNLAFGTPQLLAAFDATGMTGFTRVGCGVVNDEYQLITAPSAALLAAADGVTVIAAAAPAGAVWARAFCRNLPAQYETTWFLDAAAGDDRNAGTTVGTPLKTVRELSNRLKGAHLTANVSVTLAAGNYATNPVQFDLEIDQGIVFSWTGAVTSSAADLVAVILPTVPGTATTNAGAQRGTLTSTAYAFAAADDRQRLRITAGTAANIGGMAFVTRVVTPGVGGVVNTTRWGKLPTPATSTLVTNLTIAAGDSFVVDTLNTQLGYIDVRVRGNGKFLIQDCLIRPTQTSSVTHRALCDNGNVNGFHTYGCIFQAASALLFQDGQWTASVCSMSSDNGNIVYASTDIVGHRMCVWTGTAAVPAFTLGIRNSANLQINEGACIDGGQIVLQTGGIWDQTGEAGNDAQFVDGTGTHAVDVAAGGLFWNHSGTNPIWGLNNAYTSTAVIVEQTGIWEYGSVPSIPGTGVVGADYSVGGTTGLWATLPIIKTTAAAGTAASAGAGCMMVS